MHLYFRSCSLMTRSCSWQILSRSTKRSWLAGYPLPWQMSAGTNVGKMSQIFSSRMAPSRIPSKFDTMNGEIWSDQQLRSSENRKKLARKGSPWLCWTTQCWTWLDEKPQTWSPLTLRTWQSRCKLKAMIYFTSSNIMFFKFFGLTHSM